MATAAVTTLQLRAYFCTVRTVSRPSSSLQLNSSTVVANNVVAAGFATGTCAASCTSVHRRRRESYGLLLEEHRRRPERLTCWAAETAADPPSTSKAAVPPTDSPAPKAAASKDSPAPKAAPTKDAPPTSKAAAAPEDAPAAKPPPEEAPPKKPPKPSLSKGTVVRVDKEKYLDSVEYYAVAHPKFYKGIDYIYEDRGEILDVRFFEAGEYALVSWAGISTSPAWLPVYMLIKSEKLSYKRV